MKSTDLHNWAWGEALSLLDHADRLQRQFFRMRGSVPVQWEPPIDIVETADSLTITIALPGVARDSIVVSLEPGTVTVSALRPFPAGGEALIHRVEIPHGRFERRIPVPPALVETALEPVQNSLADGCLTLVFAKRPAQELK